MGSGPRLEEPTLRAVSGLRLGRRSIARPHRTRLVSQGIQERAGSPPLRRRVLVARADELGKLAARGSDPAPQLVAGTLSRRLPTVERRTRPSCAGLFNHL